MLYLVVLCVLLLIVSYGLLRRAEQFRVKTGLPRGKVVYRDTGAWKEVATPLFSRRHTLTGRPDYLVETADGLVPVEVKPTRTANIPYDGDVLQLAAYCLLVEENFGQRPAYGLLQYRDQTFQIAYTQALQKQLLDTLAAMRSDAGAPEVNRSHSQAGRCRACGLRAACDQRLV